MSSSTYTDVLSYQKNKTKIGIALVTLAAAIAAAFVVGGGQTNAAVGGPTCNVPADYATIQLAVDAAGCNTVKVAAGARTENVTITRSVYLKGAKAGVDVGSRSFGSAGETKVTGLITVNAADVKVDGFSLTNPNQGNGLVVKTAGNNALIKNNFVDTVGGAAFASNATGIYMEYGPDNVTVSNNKISNIMSVPTAQGMLVGDSTSADPSLDILIKDNKVTKVTSSTKGAYGIQLNNGAKPDNTGAVGYTDARITGNIIKNLTGNWAHGIGLEGDTPYVVVKKNVISNLTDASPTPIPATANTPASNFYDVVGVNFEDNPSFPTAKVHRNSLAVGATGFGIGVNPNLALTNPNVSVNGQCNWWGANNGPSGAGGGTGSMVSPNVFFDPWLKSSNLDGKCGDKQGHDFDCGKDDDHHGHKDNNKHNSWWNWWNRNSNKHHN